MHLKKRGKKYYFVVSVRDEYGKPKQIERVVGGTTKVAARLATEQFLRTHTNYYGTLKEPGAMEFSQLFENFMTDYVEVNRKPATIRSYLQLGTNHLLPSLGTVELRNLNTRMLQHLLNEKSETLSASPIGSILTVLRNCIHYACNYGVIHEDPTQFLITPPAKKPPKKLRIFNQDELTVMMDAFPIHHPFYAPIRLAYYTGMRMGECMALKWSDIDFDEGTIHIHATLFDNYGIGEIQPTPKNFNSVRTIPVSTKGMKTIKAIRADQQQKFLAMGLPWNENVTVCTDDQCRLMTSDRSDSLSSSAKRTLAAAVSIAFVIYHVARSW